MKKTNVCIFVMLLLNLITLHGVEKKTSTKGYNGLYMGHSFFWPSVKELKIIMPETNVTGHQQSTVFSGGASGSPGRLWDSRRKRAEGQKILDSKKINLLVMTYYSPENSSVEHYSRWFDYALSKNPQTTFMVAIPWAGQLYKMDKKQRARSKMGIHRIYQSVIVKLRKKYPKNKILYCPYGVGTYELINQFEAGKLPGVKHILNLNRQKRVASKKNNDQLLNDELGHPGKLVISVATLLWLQTIYEYDVSAMKHKRITGLPKIDFVSISAEVHKTIKPFNAVYEKKP